MSETYTGLTEIDARKGGTITNKKTSPAARKTRSEEARDIADNVFGGKGSENLDNSKYEGQDLRQSIFGYHGSGAKFEKFDRAAIGSGQGAQAYG